MARPICDAADGGQILVSDVVHDLGARIGFGFLDAGLRPLKGFQEPSRLFELQRDRAN
jgi:class 3 adenylate cyclase